jgi:hypothetical protein
MTGHERCGMCGRAWEAVEHHDPSKSRYGPVQRRDARGRWVWVRHHPFVSPKEDEP